VEVEVLSPASLTLSRESFCPLGEWILEVPGPPSRRKTYWLRLRRCVRGRRTLSMLIDAKEAAPDSIRG